MQTFKDEESLLVVDSYVYKDLDQGNINIQIRNNLSSQPTNDKLFNLRKQYSDMKSQEENVLADSLFFEHGQYKKLHNFQRSIIIPPKQPLYFYSRFETGNLAKVIKKWKPVVKSLAMQPVLQQKFENEYDLYLRPDTSTDTHMHWFYFQVKLLDVEKGMKFRLHIRNLVRPKSLF